MRMLIVDDSEVARMVLTSMMSHYGECDNAADGLEAVEAFRKALAENKHYDLIFMDIMMPNMNGIDAVNGIRKIEAETYGEDSKEGVKIIMTSALTDHQVVIESYYRGGANSYITKPIDKRILFREIENLGFKITETEGR